MVRLRGHLHRLVGYSGAVMLWNIRLSIVPPGPSDDWGPQAVVLPAGEANWTCYTACIASLTLVFFLYQVPAAEGAAAAVAAAAATAERKAVACARLGVYGLLEEK